MTATEIVKETIRKYMPDEDGELFRTLLSVSKEISLRLKCQNCEHLYIKDLTIGVCDLTDTIVQPNEPCKAFNGRKE